MSATGAAMNLALLDELRLATLDPAVWTLNLRALAADQPELAAELERTTLPAAWQPALALDDFVTWRLEEPGQPPIWLGESAAPRTRARALLAQFDPHGKNPALPCLGCGAELRVLLDRLPAYTAAFVFETDLRVLAAVLRTQDVADAIARGRCVFVPPGREVASLEQRLAHHPGLLPPGDIVLPNLVAETRVAELRTTCEQVLANLQKRQEEELQALEARAATRTPAAPSATPRLAILALGPDPGAHAIADSLQRAAAGLGWEVLHRALSAPASVHPLSHSRVLADFQPELTICVNHPRDWLPLAPPGRTCIWVLGETTASMERPEDNVVYLAASPLIHATLRRSGVPKTAVRDCFWACEPHAPQPSPATPDAALVLVADLPPTDAQAHGITPSGHQLLWTQLRTAATRAWATPTILEPAKLLVRAERECGVELTDPELRELFLKLIERSLIPGVVAEQIARALANQPQGLLTLGSGWENFADRQVKPLATGWLEMYQRNTVWQPRAWIFAGHRDPLGPALLYAAASGRPVLVHSLGGRALDPQLGGVLRAGQHFLPFTEVGDLRRGLDSLAQAPARGQQLADRARQHVTEHHSYAARLRELSALRPEPRTGTNPADRA